MASHRPGPSTSYDGYVLNEEGYDDGPWPREEWTPGQDDPRSRGRRRAPKQTRGSMARSGAVLGVGVFAAVGASSMAQAQSKPPVAISMPEPVADVAHGIAGSLPDADSLPGVGSLLSDEDGATTTTTTASTPLTQVGLAGEDGTTAVDSGEALRARILEQAEEQQAAADAAELAALKQAAAEKAAAEAEKAKAEAEAEKQRLEEEARRKAEEAAKAKAEAERLAKLAASYIAPLSSYSITAVYGQAGDMWSSGYHTGLDFAASTGTPIKNVHTGTITSAGWAGSAYGYQIIVTLDDGTEVWYNHLSSILKSSGKVTTGEVIGRVGATGNVSGAHLHLEVHTSGGAGVDPMAWLRNHGATV
ncbi:M23 family metallopeptidase [Streptomyces polyrhachis]|uniref:M23 family metallopeptidase n=1 Tax=Streptomyces polyrhachis TaxID=1282885 RepID=A0ABW2GQB0_9ACTN